MDISYLIGQVRDILLVHPDAVGACVGCLALIVGGVVVVPRAVVCLALGAAFGWLGIVYAMAGTAGGASVGFYVARLLLRKRISKIVSRRPALSGILAAVAEDGWRTVFLLRFGSPLPGPLLNFCFGITRVKFSHYFVATMLGVLPQTALFIYWGQQGASLLRGGPEDHSGGALLAVGIAFSTVALWRVRTLARRRHAVLQSATA